MLQLSCSQKFMINILKQGYIPQHVAFIMDGNRRHAKKLNKESYKGHEDGKQSLKKYLLYCLELGIQQTSFYCFSIENFNRSELEVNKLMELVLNTFDQVSEVRQFVLKKDVKVNIVGKIDLLRQDVANCLKKVADETKNNKSMIVNLCFAYDSLDEINVAIKKANKSNQDTDKPPNYSEIFANLMISKPIDILVRTSNESRLSNYMLMQNCYSLIYILKQNWPQISILCLAKILLHYNFNYKSIQKKKKQWQKNMINQQTEQKQKLL